ncbi:hypothetical protein ACN47E_001940 [Coniothyrium glycines]
MPEDVHCEGLPTAIPDLASRIERLLARQKLNPRQRILIALAGVPGSGKSTVSSAVLAELEARRVGDVAVVPMDGFHYTQKMLSTFSDPEHAFRRRGAPFTFDAQSCVELVGRLQVMKVTAYDEPEVHILAPSFDHALKDPVVNDICISSRTRLVVIEGNYTLLNQRPWSEIAEVCRERWFVDAPVEIVRQRLAKRHVAAGIEDSMAAAIHRAEENDIPNGELIRSLLIEPDVTIVN